MKSDELNLKRERELNDLMYKIKRDELNRLKDDTDRTDKTNQIDETNQVDENELELIKAKLALGDLKPLRPLKPLDLPISRPPDTPRIKDIPKIQKNEKSIDEEMNNTLNSISKNKAKSYGPGIGFATRAKELEIENEYNNINKLNDKLKNNDLTLAEYKKISDNIDQLKESISKKEQE